MVILRYFLYFYPAGNVKKIAGDNKLEKLKFWKNEKNTWKYYLLHMCTINEDHMMYNSWDIRRNRHSFLSFWVIIYPFPLLTTQKIKIFTIWRKHLGISSVYTWFLRYKRQQTWNNWNNWDNFCLFTPLTTRKIKILEQWKKHLEILSFYTFVP